MNIENELRLKHIEFIQAVIERHAQNSFLIRGWSVALFTIILTFVGTLNLNPSMVFFALIPVIGFWYLDAYYLRQERLFRKLYDAVTQDIKGNAQNIPYLLLDTERFSDEVPSILYLIFSQTVLVIPLSTIILCITVSIILG